MSKSVTLILEVSGMLTAMTTRTYVFIIVNRLEMLTAKFRFPVIKMLKVSGVKMSGCQKRGAGTVPAVAQHSDGTHRRG